MKNHNVNHRCPLCGPSPTTNISNLFLIMDAGVRVQNIGQPKLELGNIDTIKKQVRRGFLIDVTNVAF